MLQKTLNLSDLSEIVRYLNIQITIHFDQIHSTGEKISYTRPALKMLLRAFRLFIMAFQLKISLRNVE